ncbi:MAG: hypothetical protein AAF441_24940 [Pseudomonadota bacterium]
MTKRKSTKTNSPRSPRSDDRRDDPEVLTSQYDTIAFPEYLTGGVATAATLWKEPPRTPVRLKTV